LSEKKKISNVNNHQYQLEEYYKEVKIEFIIISVVSIFFPIMLLIFIPWFVFGIRRSYSEIKQLRDNKAEKLLFENLKTESIYFEYLFVIYALYDIKCTGLKRLVSDEISRLAKQPLYIKTSMVKIHHLGKVLAMIESSEIKNVEPKSDLEITKVHFIDKEPKETKCMITKIAIDFDKKEVVICPVCLNYAEKDSLKNWLKENNFCPICKAKLTIDDFPLIFLKK
jgi:hypothetical protein